LVEQVAPIIEEIENANEERLAGLVEENLEAIKPVPRPSRKRSRAGRPALTPVLSKAQLFCLAWLVVLIMSIPGFRDYDQDELEAAANTSQDFAMSLAAGLTLWGLMGVGRDD
jgi:hypothetical protein